jgi:hypothetical protein
MQGLRSLFTVSLTLGLLGFIRGGQAQTRQAPPEKPHFVYDVVRQGPLLIVLGPDFEGFSQFIPERQEETMASLDSHGKRVLVGGLTVVVPKTMQIIETKPGKADPYASLKAEERLQVLLSFFDAAQWAQAGSAQGIGLADMSDTQKSLYLSLLPEKMTVQRSRLTVGDNPEETRYEPQGAAQDSDPLETRLRLVRKIRLGFSKVNTEDFGYLSFPDDDAQEEVVQVTSGDQPRGDKHLETEESVVFGVPILRLVPNRLKPGDLDFADPKLNPLITLESDLKTLGDLMKRVAKTTGMDLMADKRVVGLPLVLRTLPGRDQVRAGDVLQALCWSVTGAFRRVGDSTTYLLTDDVAGIGARFARLEEWAEEADDIRRAAIDKAGEAAVKHDPLAHIGFAPGDPYRLPTDLMRRVDDLYRKGGDHADPVFTFKELPGALQRSAMRDVESWAQDGTPVRTDRLSLDMEMSVQFVVPGGMAVTPRFVERLGLGYLQSVAAFRISAPAVRKAALPAKPMSEAVTKRVLLARLPPDDQALATLLSIAKTKGFTEVWLHVRLDEPQAPERLKRAQGKGKRFGLAIGGAVSLLRGGGMPGPEDVNILGETGAAFVKRKVSAAPQYRGYYARISDWTLLSADRTISLLTPLAQIPGLSALVLKASAAPGWVGDVSGGDGIMTNGELGFGPDTRLACLKAEGFDPIDVGPYPHALGQAGSLHFFPHLNSDGLSKTLSDFRGRLNQKSLGQIHKALRKLAPQLPLYLDDRAGAYTDPTLRWFGRWDDPARMVVNPVYFIDSEGREAAFAGSPEPLLRCPPWNGKPEGLAVVLGEMSEKAVKKWPGIALDLTGFAPAEALKQLGGLPGFPASPR